VPFVLSVVMRVHCFIILGVVYWLLFCSVRLCWKSFVLSVAFSKQNGIILSVICWVYLCSVLLCWLSFFGQCTNACAVSLFWVVCVLSVIKANVIMINAAVPNSCERNVVSKKDRNQSKDVIQNKRNVIPSFFQPGLTFKKLLTNILRSHFYGNTLTAKNTYFIKHFC
jgi:hypothetical protein